jgi:hypothetical protein
MTNTTTESSQAGGEREAFEAWAKKYGRIFLDRQPHGPYMHVYTQEAWVGWQARAALSAPPAVPDTESTRARLEYAARSLRSIADKGRVGLGDSYPEIVALWATIRDIAAAPPVAAVAQPVAPGWNEAVEAAAKVLDNGSFLHKDSPVKKWATEAVQAVRKLLRPLGAVESDGLPIDKPKSAAPYLSPREKRLRDAVRKMHQWREEKRAALTVAALAPIPYAEHEAEMLAVIDERDRYHDMADQLAAHIAAITGYEIGEHSSDNDPWSNALICANEWLALAASPIAPQAGQAGESGEALDRLSVNADALYQVLQALVGPAHHIRELQATRSLHKLGHTNAIETLLEDYEAAALRAQAAPTKGGV